MAQSSFKLALTIGASIGQSFTGALKSSQTQLAQLGTSINKLKGQSAAIKKVELAEVNVGKARLAYNSASKEVMGLRKEIAQTSQPSRQLSQSFEAAKQKAVNLSNKLATQKEHLNRARRALDLTGASTNKLAKDHGKLGVSIARLSQKYRKLSQAIKAGEAIKAKRSALRGQLFDALALGSALVAPIKVAVGFEQAIAKLGAITQASDDARQTLEKTARTLGETTQFSASEAASAMTFLGMAGFKTNEIIAASPGLLNLAQAAGSDLAQSADIASNILSGFSFKAAEMGHVGDVLAATFTSSNTTLEMLGDTLKYVAPVANSAGASIEEVASMVGLLGNVGIQGSQAGTTLRTAFLRLSSPPKAAADALGSLGVEVSDLRGNLRPVPALLKAIGQATQDLGSSEQAAIIQQIFGTQAAAGLTELLKQAGSGALDAYISQLNDAQGMAADMASQMSATTYGALKRLGSSMESVAISLGSVLLPSVAAGAEGFAKMAGFVSRATQAHPVLSKVIIGTTAALMALKVVSIAGAYAFTFIQGGILSLVTAYRSLAAGIALARVGMVRMNILSTLSAVRMGVLTVAQWALNIAMRANPIGLIVTGLSLLAGSAVLLIKYWEPVGIFFSNLWSGIQTITQGSVDWILGKIQLLNKPFEWMGKVGNKLMGWLGGDSKKEVHASISNQMHTPTTAILGHTIAAKPTMASVIPPVDAMPTDISSRSSTTTQTINIDAPITIHAATGMDAKAIADEVQKALDMREQRAAVHSRAFLYDTANT